MLGAFANVLLFLMSLIGVGIVGAFLFAYTAHCLLVVVTDTASGQDEIRFPGDPVLDWLGQSLQVAVVLALWLVPAGFLSRALSQTLFPDNGGLRLLVLAVPGLWLFFPVGLLSSLSAASPFVVLRAAIVARLLRVLPSLLVFYAATAVVAGVAAWLWGLSLFTEHFYLVPVAAVVGASAVLVYARLLGRLAWLVRRSPERKKPESPAGRLPPRKRARVKAQDPWGDRAPAPKSAPAAARKKPRPAADDGPGLTPYGTRAEPVEPYGLADDALFIPPVFERAAAPRPAADDFPMPTDDENQSAPRRERPDLRPSELEMRLRERTPDSRPPPFPLFSGVYSFPWYGHSFSVWARLVIGATVVGFGVCFMLAHFPG